MFFLIHQPGKKKGSSTKRGMKRDTILASHSRRNHYYCSTSSCTCYFISYFFSELYDNSLLLTGNLNDDVAEVDKIKSVGERD